MVLKNFYSKVEIEGLISSYKIPKNKKECSPDWTKYILVTHPVQFISTIGRVNGKIITNVAPFATCLDTSYQPPYVTFSCAINQHSIRGQSKTNSKMNTYLNIIQNGLFIVNTPDRSLLTKLDIVSYPYLRKHLEDKIEKAGFTKLSPFILSIKHKLYPPIIQECLVHLECEVVDIHCPKGSDHSLITGRVVGASFDKNLGNTIDKVRCNIAKRAFHHFGASVSNPSNRFIGYVKPSSVPAITFKLEQKK